MTKEEVLRNRIEALEEHCKELQDLLRKEEEARKQSETKEAAMRSVLLYYQNQGGYRG